ncbi:MAG TPA: Ig-like domain-containing protein [Pseudomonas sp.]|nr:Ig-like domain-containing protein [Pseudomonas sp.]
MRTHKTDPLKADTDGDGLSDGAEVGNIPASSPLKVDTDGDGISDPLELQMGLNPSEAADGLSDKDSDGLSNAREVLLGTTINNPDTDGDTLKDGAEVDQLGTDPLKKDTDGDGLRDDEDSQPLIKDTQAPVVQLVNPAPGKQLIKGLRLTITPGLQDNGRVTQVAVRLNGAQIALLTSAPFTYAMTLPSEADSLRLELVATDTNGNQGSSGEHSFSLIQDPLTTVIGRVLDSEGQPVVGAELDAHGLTAISQDDGSFVITGVPVAPGAVTVIANGLLGSQAVTSASAEFQPVWGGTTDVGSITLVSPKVRVGYFNATANTGQAYQKALIERAGYEPVLISNLAAFDLAQVDMLIVDSSRTYYGNGNYSNNRAKVFSFVQNGGVLLLNEEHNNSTGPLVDLPGQPTSESMWIGYNYQPIVPTLRWSEISEGKAGSWWPYRTTGYGGFAYLPLDKLAETTVPLTFSGVRGDKRITSIRYPYGNGQVYFGYAPTYGWRPGESDPLFTIYQPNVLVMMRELTLKDSDQDGLKDIYEYANGTSAFQSDRDGDGLLDGFEVKYGFNPKVAGEQFLNNDGDDLNNLREQELGTHPRQTDSDADSLSDSAEVDLHNSDPLNEDTDYDRVLDNLEVLHKADPRKADTDGDGVGDYEEINTYLTKPDLADTDGDGLSDFIETKGPYEDILDPKNKLDAEQDHDQDGLSNKQELLETLTNPKVKDSDGDGLSDGAEVLAGLNPLDRDMDKDGLLDGEDGEPQTKDGEAPQVSLSAPVSGSSLVHGQQVRLQATASDNGRVVGVTFYINGVEVATDAEAPYEYVIGVPEQGSELQVEVSAVDTNGNARRTPVQRFNLIADPGTQVIGRVLDSAGNPVAGASIFVLNDLGEASVKPVAYAMDQAPSSSYSDNSGLQLNDDQVGVAGYNVNLGQGTAYEWLGWNAKPTVNIDFDFGRTVFIDSIRVGATQEDTGNVVLPSIEVFKKVGESWVAAGSLPVPVSSANSYSNGSLSPRRSLDISGLNLNSRYVRVTLKANGNWSFVDEIDFSRNGPSSNNSSSAVVTTDSQGRFLATIATVLLDPQIKATALFGGQSVTALSSVFETVRGGISDVGDLVVAAQGRRAFEPIQARHLAYEAREQNAYKTLNNQQLWDFYTYYGNVQTGTNYGFNNVQYLLVNENYYTNDSPHPYLMRLAGRELTLPERQMGSVKVSRKLYVPAGRSYARYLDLFENTTDQAVTIPVRLYGNFYNGGRVVVATSTGDQTFNTLDRYLVTDDGTDNGGRTASGLLFGGQSAPVQPTVASGDQNSYSVSYSLTLPPRSRKALLHYAVQNNSRAEVKRIIEELAAPNFEEPELTVEEHRAIANWTTQVDTDLDGIADADEVPLGLDPVKADTDGDELRDGFERRYGFDPKVNEGQTGDDPDTDGLSNLEEQEAGSHPHTPDTDGDSLRDGDEVKIHHSNPLARDTDLDRLLDADEVSRGTSPDKADSDEDGLDDYVEIYSHGTDPLKKDSDADGMPDKFEVDYSLLTQGAADDKDNDGLSNLAEFQAGTRPDVADTDSDELLDAWEVLGTPPSNPLQADGDGAGRRDINERFVDGTDPKLASDDRPNINGARSVKDENNRNWDIWYNGDVTGTTGSAVYSNWAFGLFINNSQYWYAHNHATSSANGREYHYEARKINNLIVSRRVLVPNVGGAYVRYLEILDNPTTQEQVANVRLQSYYGAANDGQVAAATSSGDAQLSIADDYLALRDTAVPTRPVLLHVFAGNAQRRQGTSFVNQAGRLWQTDYQVRIPAGERRVIMHFATLEGSNDAAMLTAAKLRSLKGLGLDNLDATLAGKVVNFFAFADNDEDGLSDADETRLGSDSNDTDSDDDNIPDGQDAEPMTADVSLPNVSIESLMAKRRYPGDSLEIKASITDNGLIKTVELFQDGQLIETRTQGGEQSFSLLLPDTEASQLTLRVTDSNGNVGEAEVTVAIHEVPEIRLSGRVVDALDQPVAGAQVELEGVKVDTDAQGRFALSVFSIERDFTLSASALFGAQDMRVEKAIAVTSLEDLVDLGDLGDLKLVGVGRHGLNPIAQSELSYEGTEWNYNKTLENQYRWDFNTSYGDVEYGTDNAFSGAQYLLVNGSYVSNSQSNAYQLRLNGRELTYPIRQMSGLNIRRKVYVPAAGSYARFIESFENPGSQPVTVQVRLNGSFYYTGDRTLVATSSGDQAFTTADRYLLTDDATDAAGKPAAGVLFGGLGAPSQPTAVSGNENNYDVTYSLTIPAGGRQVLMHYAVQNHSRAEAKRVLDELSDPNFADEGLTHEELRDLVNWRTLVDSDKDGQPDAEEVPLGLDPQNPDWDNDGIPDGQDSEPKDPDSQAPVISLTTADGPFYAGDPLAVSLDAQDNGLVKTVTLLQDGAEIGSHQGAGPHSYDLTLPGVGSTHIEARAVDSNGNLATQTLDLTVEAVPASSIAGQVVNRLGKPVANARVSLAVQGDEGGETPSLMARLFGGEEEELITDSEGRFLFSDIDRRANPSWRISVRYLALDVPVEASHDVYLEADAPFDAGTIELAVDDRYVAPLTGDLGTRYYPDSQNFSLPVDFAFSEKRVSVDVWSQEVRIGDLRIVPLQGNLQPVDNADSFYAAQLDERLVLTWKGWQPNSEVASEAPFDMQVILHRDGRIETRYYQMPQEGWYNWMAARFEHGESIDETVGIDFTDAQARQVFKGSPVREEFYGRPDLEGWSISYVPTPEGSYQIQLQRLPGYPDSDGDGLSDANETLLGTDLEKKDTDGDLLWDGFELYNGFDPLTAEEGIASADPDEDTLSNLEEQQQGTDPHNGDSDDDDLSDADEVRLHNTDPTLADSDGDGLNDEREIDEGTDPRKSDTDGDGLFDKEELDRFGTDPTTAHSDEDGMPDKFEADYDLFEASAEGDEDEDGLSNIEEYRQGTHPRKRDGDGDGLPDAFEIGLPGLSPSKFDTDGSGRGDGDELFVDGTDPENAADDVQQLPNEDRAYLLTESGIQVELPRNGAFSFDNVAGNGSALPLERGLQLDGYDFGDNGEGGSQNDRLARGLSSSADGRTWRTPLQEIEPGLLVSREFYVPAEGRGYVRVLDKFFNISAATLIARPRLVSSNGYSSNGYQQATSSGDAQLDVQDRWLRQSRQAYEGGEPDPISLMHVFADEAGRQSLNSEHVSSDAYYNWSLGYRFEVPANEHRVVLSFLALEHSEHGNDNLQVLSALGEDVLRGISATDRSRLVNFTACADADLDQLCDSDEGRLGTRADQADSDGDRFEDELEHRLGSDPLDPQSMPVFDIYSLSAGDEQQLFKQRGFDGASTELKALSGSVTAIDFDDNGRFWMAEDSSDGPAISEFDPQTFEPRGNSFYSGIDGAPTDILGWSVLGSLHLQDHQEEGDEESGEGVSALMVVVEQDLVLGLGDWTAARLREDNRCGSGLAKWKGEPLYLNGCKLVRFDYSTSEEHQPLVDLHFSTDFAEQPRVLALDDMPQANGLVALIEDSLEGSARRHLGFIDMRTGEVVRLGAMPADAQGLSVKFKDFQNEPVWSGQPVEMPN